MIYMIQGREKIWILLLLLLSSQLRLERVWGIRLSWFSVKSILTKNLRLQLSISFLLFPTLSQHPTKHIYIHRERERERERPEGRGACWPPLAKVGRREEDKVRETMSRAKRSFILVIMITSYELRLTGWSFTYVVVALSLSLCLRFSVRFYNFIMCEHRASETPPHLVSSRGNSVALKYNKINFRQWNKY
jgi:hypothetical protein